MPRPPLNAKHFGAHGRAASRTIAQTGRTQDIWHGTESSTTLLLNDKPL
jgi:hypothetical protein